MQEPRTDRPLRDLFSELSDDVQKLIRQEIELAKTELSEQLQYLRSSSKKIAVGAILAGMGSLALLAAAILALALFVPAWLSALIIGTAILLIGALLLLSGLGDLKQVEIAPQRIVNSLRRDVRWARKEAHERAQHV